MCFCYSNTETKVIKLPEIFLYAVIALRTSSSAPLTVQKYLSRLAGFCAASAQLEHQPGLRLKVIGRYKRVCLN